MAPMPSLQVDTIRVRDFRNIGLLEFAPAPHLNVIVGGNGQGKTSVLEAIYFATTSRSFRTHRTVEVVAHGCRATAVQARLTESGGNTPPLSREQTAVIQNSVCSVRLDGARPASLGEYATRSPVVAFHTEELALSTGPASGRRRLLDRLALFMSPVSADHRTRYARALKARHQVLRQGVDQVTTHLDAFEELCAYHGAALTRCREQAAAALAADLQPAFKHMAAPDLTLNARFVPGGSSDAAVAKAELTRQRARDAHRPTAGFGPHRDDFELLLGDHPVRLVASQGQHRVITLALKAAEAAAIAAARGVEPILLLDDVSSELDADRTVGLFRFLSLSRRQIFLTTTRPELIVTPDLTSADRQDFEVRCGSLSRVG